MPTQVFPSLDFAYWTRTCAYALGLYGAAVSCTRRTQSQLVLRSCRILDFSVTATGAACSYVEIWTHTSATSSPLPARSSALGDFWPVQYLTTSRPSLCHSKFLIFRQYYYRMAWVLSPRLLSDCFTLSKVCCGIPSPFLLALLENLVFTIFKKFYTKFWYN